jgi:hypothetical protein
MCFIILARTGRPTPNSCAVQCRAILGFEGRASFVPEAQTGFETVGAR